MRDCLLRPSSGLPKKQLKSSAFARPMIAAYCVFVSQVEDNQDGTYRCTYVTSKAGAYKISVTLNGGDPPLLDQES